MAPKHDRREMHDVPEIDEFLCPIRYWCAEMKGMEEVFKCSSTSGFGNLPFLLA